MKKRILKQESIFLIVNKFNKIRFANEFFPKKKNKNFIFSIETRRGI